MKRQPAGCPAERSKEEPRRSRRALTIPQMWAKMNRVLPAIPTFRAQAFLSSIVGLWRSWERASMAWKRSSVRSRPGPPISPSDFRLLPAKLEPAQSDRYPELRAA